MKFARLASSVFVLKIVFTIIAVLIAVCMVYYFNRLCFSENTTIKAVINPNESIIKKLSSRQKKISDKGLYITSWSAQSKQKMDYIKNILKTRGLNTIVVDVNYFLEEPLLKLAKEKKLNKNTIVTASPWLTKFVEDMHKDGVIVSARIVAFKDDHLIIARPDLSIRLPDGKEYRDHKNGRWVDPYSEEGCLFKELLAERAALSGVDEIQFDYIRFPAEGAAENIVLPHKKIYLQKAGTTEIDRVDIICRFLKNTRQRLQKYNVSMALDIFGIIAWQEKRDIKTLGQDLKKMSEFLDVLSPMLYPSHFHNGYDGYSNPGSEPYHFMYVGVKKSLEILSGEATVLVPWIQGFNLKSPNYGPAYIDAQIKACKDLGVNKYLIWNARNVYDSVYVKKI
ncbi:hypothetical protein A3J90_03340 [candidate division WOR-1 bacterium RIFOXYC2_FULL_37_10]|uniref:DUF4015 domain-containing protein n=1 Tax=candidate division WOR-1 bacterium RIFOXYB2_FULL_37_13 TaxID=1802579 RepID=A0A1F4SKN4_UNCSA|nr:MAG: hypothetical protein A2246_02425 [candidate division WOR-1 bacterium RIFOXYA2_FULL_37_7]OGC21024.1 MAG: hypothetical protein A2310_00705 [candidate division WOR-1 bacterium RIFOXYB2_FULL_37_13]OGC36780.1 MAG: hypothetical protein A3J90_03340 [candidate division WOR-1 bacterium RIFOXYC2_FULL_37_10]